MNFGISGAIGACSSHIYSNPVTIAAVKRHREKERLANDGAYRSRKENLERIKAQVAADLEVKEERFRREFLFDITKRRIGAIQVSRQKRVVESIKELVREPDVRLRADDIIRYHAAQSPYTYEDIIGNRRYRDLVLIRQQIMADVYVLCPHLSLPQIGKAFGGKDHTTILHAVLKMGVHYSQTGVKRESGNSISTGNFVSLRNMDAVVR